MHLFQYWPAEIDHLKRRKQKSEVTGFLDHFTAAYSGAALVFLDTDLRYLFQKVAQFVFEQEFAIKQDYRMTAKTFTHMMLNVRASLSADVVEEFEKDSISYSRV